MGTHVRIKDFKIKKKIESKNTHKKNKDYGFQSYHFIANSWGNNGNRDKLNFSGSKITADGDCSNEIKRCLLLGKKQ